MMKRITILCSVLLAFGGCMEVGDEDAQLTQAETQALPEAPDEVDATALAAAQAVDPSTEADAPAFDDDTAEEVDDQPVDDDDDASDNASVFDPDQEWAGDPPLTLTQYAALLKWGLHPRASDALRAAGVSSSRIMQTIGNAAASAGTHAQDGTVNGHPYSAATDLSVRGLSSTQIKHLLEKLGRVGFAAWYRQPGHDGWPSYEIAHIHAVYANCKMKTSLRSQIRSWLVGRNGLRSNAVYHFYVWSATAKGVVRSKFAASASGTTNAGSTCVSGGTYCGGDKISGNHAYLYRCTGAGAPTLVKKCANGCSVNAGRDDSCR